MLLLKILCKRSIFIGLKTLALSVFLVQPALAHSISLFAIVDGKEIVGHAYSADGEPIKSITVSITNPSGKEFGEVKSDDKGKFTFKPEFRCDYIFTFDSGDGHRADWAVEMRELPADLPLYGELDSSPDSSETPDASVSSDSQSLHDMFESYSQSHNHANEEVANEIISLRAQMDQLSAQIVKDRIKIRKKDIVGGFGYIAGITGIAFYILGLIQRRKSRDMEGKDADI